MKQTHQPPRRVTVFGASGRTGRLVVEEALAAGLDVTAFVRDPARLPVRHERLRVVQGDVTDAAKVEEAVAGADAVISTLGQAKGSPKDVLTRFADTVTAAMRKHDTRRIITLTGAAVNIPGDEAPTFGRRFMQTLMKLVAADMLTDAQAHADKVLQSGLTWTVARPPRLIDGPRTGSYRAGAFLHLGPKAKLSRSDLAHFMVSQVNDTSFLNRAPMVTT